jgi:hypothetical protein
MRYAWTNCPGETFLARNLTPGLEAGIGMFLWFPIIAVGGLLTISPKAKNAGAWLALLNRHFSAFVFGPLGALLLSTALILDGGAFSYFCATPDGVLIHPGELFPVEHLSWKSLKTIRPECRKMDYGLNVTVDLAFSDGRTITMGDQTAKQLYENYSAFSSAVRNVPAVYDMSRIGECSKEWHDLFVRRP